MKKAFVLIVGLVMVSGAMGQQNKPSTSCLPQGIVFNRQVQVDSFSVNYPNCTEIEGYVAIGSGWEDTTDISNLNGLSVLTSLGSSLHLGAWDLVFPQNLTSLSGLDNIISIGGHLEICGSQFLTNLSGLESLTSIGGGNISIYWNNALTSLTGLDNINASSIGDLLISDNPSLSTCEVQSICDYLISPNGTVDITGNAKGCNSLEEVDSACVNLSGGEVNLQSICKIHPNPSSSTICISASTASNKNTFLSLSNINGQVITSRQITEQQTLVDVTGLPRGIYIVKVLDDTTVRLQKFIKQ